MSVAEYLNRARDCLDLADDVDGEFREVLLQVAGTVANNGRNGSRTTSADATDQTRE